MTSGFLDPMESKLQWHGDPHGAVSLLPQGLCSEAERRGERPGRAPAPLCGEGTLTQPSVAVSLSHKER